MSVNRSPSTVKTATTITMSDTAFLMLSSPRSSFIQKLIEKNGLNVKIETDKTDQFNSHFPLGKRPALLTANDEPLTETIALAYYLVGQTPYFGKSSLEKAQVMSWLSYINMEVMKAFYLLKEAGEDSEKMATAIDINVALLKSIDSKLTGGYLVGSNETAADVLLHDTIKMLFTYFAQAVGEMSAYPNISKWYNTMVSETGA